MVGRLLPKQPTRVRFPSSPPCEVLDILDADQACFACVRALVSVFIWRPPSEPAAPDHPSDATEHTQPGLGHDREQRDATPILRTAQRLDVHAQVRRDDRILGTLGTLGDTWGTPRQASLRAARSAEPRAERSAKTLAIHAASAQIDRPGRGLRGLVGAIQAYDNLARQRIDLVTAIG